MICEIHSTVCGGPRVERVRALVSRLAKMTGSRAHEVSVLFCGDRRMRALNRGYRSKDRSTDVLAFPADAAASGGMLGDIVVSVPYASRQARKLGETPAREMDRLILHGFLHLLGFDHETDGGEMEAFEARLRRRLGIAERAR